MIEEHAIVVMADQGVWVETQRRTACGQCSANKGCGTAVLQNVLGNKRSRMMVHSRVPVAVGDHVVLGLDESALVSATLNVYLLPLGLLILGAVAGQLTGEWLNLSFPTLLSVAVAVLGFVLGYRRAQRQSKLMSRDPKYRPIILRHANSVEVT